MGGLVAMMAASGIDTPMHPSIALDDPKLNIRAIVGLAPSTPAAEINPNKVIESGEFGPEEYGITSDDPVDQPAMPDLDIEERVIALASLGRESRYARGERAAGIVLGPLPCPLLIATGTEDRQWPRSRYDSMPVRAEYLSVEGASHWGLVLNRRALQTLVPAVCEWVLNTVGLSKGA
jgi:hypothetical protein